MKITRSQLKQLIKEELTRIVIPSKSIQESGDAYPTSDGTIAGALAEELAVIKNSFIQKIQPLVGVMRNELNKGMITNSDENLVMDALQRFDEDARAYAIEVAALLRNAEINDGSEAPNTESATEILVTMIRYGSIENMIDKFDSVLSGADYGTMRQIISSNQ